MNQEVTTCFPSNPTHTTPPHHCESTPHKIITSKNLPPSSRSHKKGDSSGSFHSPNGFPREFNILLTRNGLVERFSIKHPRGVVLPSHLIWLNMTRDFRLDELENSKNLFYLPIVKIPNETKMPNSSLPNTRAY